MKKTLFALTLFCCTLAACKKDDDPSKDNFSNTPLAKAAYDHNNFGIYKGIFVGSSGNLLINIYNDGSLNATLTVDGSVMNFSSNQTIPQGQDATIHFVSGSNSFDFFVDALGNGSVTGINIAGHPNPDIRILKELSTSLVRIYEGTFDGGIFNLAIRNNGAVDGAAKPSSQNPFPLMGSYNDNTQAVSGSFVDNSSEAGTFSGTISNNNVSGTWMQQDQNGSWSGHRTM